MKEINSFSQNVKQEIVSKNYSEERLISMLASFSKINGSLIIKDKQEIIVLKIENSKIAKFLYESIQKLFNLSPTISYLTRVNLNKNTCYLLSVKNDNFLSRLHLDFLHDKIDEYFFKNDERIGGYLAGAFLASGSVNSPRSTNYHLEISFTNENHAKSFIQIMNKYSGGNFLAKIIKRRDKYVVYIKRSDQISDFIILIGAIDSCLYFENTRVDRDYSNVLNRINNLDTANYQKIVKSANKDIQIIKKLIKKKGLMNIGNEKTAILCNLRMNNPEASLEELALMLSKEMHEEVSKSNVNHLLRAIRNEGRNL